MENKKAIIIGIGLGIVMLYIIAFSMQASEQDDVYFLNSGGAGSGETTECINMANQYQIIVNSTNGDCFVRALANGTGITLDTNSTHIIINGTSMLVGESTICGNVGTGETIHIVTSNCNARSLIAGDYIDITSATNNLTISGEPIGQTVASPYFQITKTNIGTSYVNIYTASFREETMTVFTTNNIQQFRIWWVWDYVGTGNHQVRWCVANVIGCTPTILFESATFTENCMEIVGFANCDSGWLDLPIAVQNNDELNLIWQGKSTVAGDDPIAFGYKIMVR